ncbi:efflux transporter, RND family, MFP subunit [Shewanella baltica OS195]|uniref:Efflux transporter, RND family, MFP subunit n=1 Tax=Shewanella baltica (strain OS195) TaxID=399599 RepID=A9KW11_SHEB9|nr:efflux RND transporter periplasmic adaptor subunit [Shewanella baltica]ABX51585.1 efflux transporter, RND family, MFP subunit [Shewanella baltica OS195]ADT96580.1 efflux transporter, RND family, MFP subunit [Shewanella baltica OS678]
MRYLMIGLYLLCFAVHASAVPVTVALPQTGSTNELLTLSGSIKSARVARLSARTDGLVAKVLVDAGSQVRAGQPLLALDDTLAVHQLAQRQADVMAAKTMLAEKQRLLTEAQTLSAQQLFPETERAIRQAALTEAEANLQSLTAALAHQKEVVARHQLMAPFAGVISSKQTETGEWVNVGTEIFTLVSQEQLWLDIQVPQEMFQSVATATHVDIAADMLPEQQFIGHVNALVPVSDHNARSFLVRLTIPEADGLLMPGTSATATFHLQRAQHSVVVPQDALVRHPDGQFSVFTVQNNIAQRHTVQVGHTSAIGIEILSPLPKDAPVVIRGNESLQDQQPVSVLNSAVGG